MQDRFGEVSRVLGHQFSPPFETYKLLACTSEEYDVVGGMGAGKGPSTNQVVIFLTVARITQLFEVLVVENGNTRRNFRIDSVERILQSDPKPGHVALRHSDSR